MIEWKGERDDGWDRGWHEHKVRQLVRLANLPFREKLAWLESAQRVVDALSSARDKRTVVSLPDGSEAASSEHSDQMETEI